MASLLKLLKAILFKFLGRLGLVSSARLWGKSMATLLTLPEEIIANIMGHLGHGFFKEQLSSLVICKRWSRIAVDEFRSHVVLNMRDISRLHERHTADSQPPLESMPSWARERLRTLRVDIHEELCDLQVLLSPVFQHVPPQEILRRTQHGTLVELAPCTKEHNILHELDKPEAAQTFRFLTQLKALKKLEVNISFYDWHPEPQSEWINPPCGTTSYSIIRQLSRVEFSSLKVLHLTISKHGSFDGLKNDTHHVCCAVNRLLRHLSGLQAVFLRLAFLCAKILARKPSTPALKTVVINCNAEDSWRFVPAVGCAMATGKSSLKDFAMDQTTTNSLVSGIARAAEKFAEAIKTPRVRITWPYLKTQDTGESSSGEPEEPMSMFSWTCAEKQMMKFLVADDWTSETRGQVIDLGNEIKSKNSRVKGLEDLLCKEEDSENLHREAEDSDSEVEA